jgi:hypothetical protein
MTDDTTLTCDRLAELLDDVLDSPEAADIGGVRRQAVAAHLAECAACRALVADLRTIRAAARTLDTVEPPERVWRAVRARVAADRPAGPPSLADRVAEWGAAWRGVYQPLAAAAVLVLIVSGLAWLGTRLDDGPTPNRPALADATTPSLVEFELAEAEYTDAIARLQEAVARPRPLDATTSATLQSSIDDVDAAIGDARDALEREPGDELSRENLLDALGSKVALLQDTVTLLGEFDEPAEEFNP